MHYTPRKYTCKLIVGVLLRNASSCYKFMFENVLQILCVQFHLKNVLRTFHQHQLLQQLPKMPLNMYPQNSVRCFTKKSILMPKIPWTPWRMFQIKTEKKTLFRTNKAMVKYIHMQSHILRQNRRLGSHQHQIHVHASHKNTIPYAQRSVV